MTEIWKTLPSNPKYLVSNEGRVRHLNSLVCRKPQLLGSYLYVNFWQDKKLRMRTVHTLIAETFLGPRPDGSAGEDVRHLDGDSINNHASNLAYGSKKQNAEDRERHGMTARGERGGNARLLDDSVDVVRIMYACGGITQREIADRFGISQAQVHNIVRNKQRVRLAAVRALAVAADPTLAGEGA